MHQTQLLTHQRNYDGALQENRKVLSVSPKSPLSSAALYSMGIIFADRANPGRDYRKALGFFTQLRNDFPQSSFAEESRTWAGILKDEVSMEAEAEARGHLQRMQLLVRKGDFEGAVRENRKILSASPQSPLSDVALYSMGLILADHANPDMDCKDALGFFAQLVKDFPQSTFADESRTWIGTLTNEVSLEREGYAYLQRMQALIRKGNFESALRENQKILSALPKSPLSDAALYSMGLIHAHYANQKRDYKAALNYFLRLKKEFPGSYLLEEARIWIGVLETMENALLIDINVDEKKKEMRK